jgi:hypothetical protein
VSHWQLSCLWAAADGIKEMVPRTIALTVGSSETSAKACHIRHMFIATDVSFAKELVA